MNLVEFRRMITNFESVDRKVRVDDLMAFHTHTHTKGKKEKEYF